MNAPETSTDIARGAYAGADLLDAVYDTLTKYVAFPSPDHAVAVTLWVAHTHGMKAFDTTPILSIQSAEPQSGKTRLLEVIERLAAKGVRSGGQTASVITRIINAMHPTLLMDEVDALFPSKGVLSESQEQLRAVINNSYRRGSYLYKTNKESMKPEQFDVFGPVALAGIRSLPDTIESRAIIIPLRRRAPEEQVAPLRFRRWEAEAAPIHDALAGWAGANLEAFRAEPELPEGLTDRPADVWEPLIAVADTAGGHWPETARRVALNMTKAQAGSGQVSWNLRVLRAVAQVFEGDRMKSSTITDALNDMEGESWGDGGMTDRKLAWALSVYDITPRQIKLGGSNRRGYLRADFEDTWNRYLPKEDDR